jgi:hypothetical protein
MYDDGNRLITNLYSWFPYTNGMIGDVNAFGEGSQYATAKYPGLFVLAATDIEITDFYITGGTGHDGQGTVDGAVLSTSVSGQPFTIYLKRTFGASNPTINQIVIVRGDGTGISHQHSSDTNIDDHTINGLAGANELYYLLVSTTGGQFLPDANVINVANAFLQNVIRGAGRSYQVSVGPGGNIEDVDFGNLAVPALLGDYNRDESVDAADYVFWRKTVGTSPVPVYDGADGDGDGSIETNDRGVWAEHFGEASSGGGAGSALDVGVTSVEPTFAISEASATVSVEGPIVAIRGSEHRSNRVATTANVDAALFLASNRTEDNSAAARYRQRIGVDSSRDVLEIALQTWLGHTVDDSDASQDVAETAFCGDDEARDEVFDSLESLRTSTTERTWHKTASRSKVQLAALR